MYKKNQNAWAEYTDFVIIELIIVECSFIAAFFLRLSAEDRTTFFNDYLLLFGIISLFNVLASCLFDAFQDIFSRSVFLEFAMSLRQTIIVFAGVSLYLFAVQKSATYSRVVLFLTFLFDLLIGFVVRMIYKKSKLAQRSHVRRMLVVTKFEIAEHVLGGLRGKGECHGKPVGFAITDKNCIGTVIEDIPVVAKMEDVIEYVRTKWIDEVLIILPGESMNKAKLIHDLTKMGITIHVGIEKIEGVPENRQMVESMGSISVVTSSINVASAGKLFVKRAFDIIIGFLGCIFTLLIALIIAPLIFIKSPGHIVFVQERVGKNGKRFKMIKFRSMIKNADAKKQELMNQNTVQDGMMFKLDWDPRVIGNRILPDGTHKSGIGEFIRRTSIDELPQFFNVLIGDMSLVGTRPPTVDEWEKYSLHHRARLSTKPGITGMWQVSGRSDITDFEEVVKLDIEYIYNWSLGLDAKILGKTIGVVLGRKGAK